MTDQRSKSRLAILFISLALNALCPCHSHAAWPAPYFFDDFEDGNAEDGSPAKWAPEVTPFEYEERKVEEGALVVSPSTSHILSFAGAPSTNYAESDTIVEGVSFGNVTIRALVTSLAGGQWYVGFVARYTYADGLINTGIYAGFRWDSWAFMGKSETVAGEYSSKDLSGFRTTFPTRQDINLKLAILDDEASFWVWPEGEASPEFPQVILSIPEDVATEGSVGVWTAQNVFGDRSIPIAYKYFAALPRPYATLIRGDFDENLTVDGADIDLLSSALRAGSTALKFDINLDNKVDSADRTFWIQDEQRTYLGDSNLDGEFNSADFVQVFQAGQYEDSITGNSTWSTGD